MPFWCNFEKNTIAKYCINNAKLLFISYVITWHVLWKVYLHSVYARCFHYRYYVNLKYLHVFMFAWIGILLQVFLITIYNEFFRGRGK